MDRNKIVLEIKSARFNVGSTSHLVRHCPLSANFSKASANRIGDLRRDNTQNAVHILLAHLCKELDSPDCAIEDTGYAQDGSQIFEKLPVSDTAGVSGNHEDSTIDSELKNLTIFSIHVDFGPTFHNFCGASIDSRVLCTVIGI